MDRKFFFALAAFGFLLFYLFLVYSVLSSLLEALAWAIILAIATFPLYRRLRTRLRPREGMAAALMTTAVALLITLPLLAILFLMVLEIDHLLDRLQILTAKGELPTLGGLTSLPGIATLRDYLQPLLENTDLSLRDTLAPALQNMATAVVDKSRALVGQSVLLVLQLFILFTSLFFFFRDGEHLLARFWSFIPLPEEQQREFGEVGKNVLMAVLYGVFLTALIQGALAGIGYWLARLPSPVLLGALTAIAALLPGIGTALVWGPAALYLLFTGHLFPGVLLLAWGTIVVASSDNFIRPYFISGRGNIPFLSVLLGIIGGLAVFGFIGILIGPVILTLLPPVLEIYRRLLPPQAGGPPVILDK